MGDRGTIKKSSSGDDEFVIQPQVRFIECPVKTIQGVLGKKWAILIIRDIGLNKIKRFNRLLESIPGITPRVLSLRKGLELEPYDASPFRRKKILTEGRNYLKFISLLGSLESHM